VLLSLIWEGTLGSAFGVKIRQNCNFGEPIYLRKRKFRGKSA